MAPREEGWGQGEFVHPDDLDDVTEEILPEDAGMDELARDLDNAQVLGDREALREAGADGSIRHILGHEVIDVARGTLAQNIMAFVMGPRENDLRFPLPQKAAGRLALLGMLGSGAAAVAEVGDLLRTLSDPQWLGLLDQSLLEFAKLGPFYSLLFIGCFLTAVLLRCPAAYGRIKALRRRRMVGMSGTTDDKAETDAQADWDRRFVGGGGDARNDQVNHPNLLLRDNGGDHQEMDLETWLQRTEEGQEGMALHSDERTIASQRALDNFEELLEEPAPEAPLPLDRSHTAGVVAVEGFDSDDELAALKAKMREGVASVAECEEAAALADINCPPVGVVGEDGEIDWSALDDLTGSTDGQSNDADPTGLYALLAQQEEAGEAEEAPVLAEVEVVETS